MKQILTMILAMAFFLVTVAARAEAPAASARLDAEAIGALMAETLSGGDPDNRFDVALDNRSLSIALPADRASDVAVEGVTFNPANGRFAAMVVTDGADGQALRTPVTGRAQPLTEVPTLSRRVRPGEVITADDIAYMDMRGSAFADAITDAKDLIGRTPRRPLLPNTVLRSRDVVVPQLVAKGAPVTVTLETPVLSLAIQGRALEAGGAGAVIRVLNPSSNRVVEAVVTGPGSATAGAAPAAPQVN